MREQGHSQMFILSQDQRSATHNSPAPPPTPPHPTHHGQDRDGWQVVSNRRRKSGHSLSHHSTGTTWAQAVGRNTQMESSPPPSLFPPTRPVQDSRRSPHPIPKLAPYPRHGQTGQGRWSHSPSTPPSIHAPAIVALQRTPHSSTPPLEAHGRHPVPDSKSQGRRCSYDPHHHHHPPPPWVRTLTNTRHHGYDGYDRFPNY